MQHKDDISAMKNFFIQRKVDIGFLFAAIVLGTFLEWNIAEILVFSVFIWSILGPIPSRFLAVPALFFLSFTPVLLFLERKEQAEEFAIYAYYFLVMAVIRGAVEVRQGGGKIGKNTVEKV